MNLILKRAKWVSVVILAITLNMLRVRLRLRDR